jgi:hypothetical protein
LTLSHHRTIAPQAHVDSVTHHGRKAVRLTVRGKILGKWSGDGGANLPVSGTWRGDRHAGRMD